MWCVVDIYQTLKLLTLMKIESDCGLRRKEQKKAAEEIMRRIWMSRWSYIKKEKNVELQNNKKEKSKQDKYVENIQESLERQKEEGCYEGGMICFIAVLLHVCGMLTFDK